MTIPLVYIAAPSYSGSTLLTFLLNAHPAIGTVGELKWGEIDLCTYQCSCQALLTRCSFWKRVQTALQARGLPCDLRRPPTDFRCRHDRLADRVARARVRGPVFERVRDSAVATLPATRTTFPTVAAVNRNMIEIILTLQEASVFVDGSKDPVRLKYLIDTEDYDIYVIQLIRDGRGVANSAIQHQGVSAEHAAREWANTHEQIERLGRRLPPGRVLPVRYEELCAAPAAGMRELFQFIGLDPAAAAPDFRAVEHHILGNGMRLRPTNAVRMDEKWRTQMPPQDVAAFERAAGNVNRKYGYT